MSECAYFWMFSKSAWSSKTKKKRYDAEQKITNYYPEKFFSQMKEPGIRQYKCV